MPSLVSSPGWFAFSPYCGRILLQKREEMKKIAALALSLFLSYGMAFADDTPKADTPKDADAPAKPAAPKPKTAADKDKSDSAIAAEIEELRQAIQAQQEELQMLKEELAKRDRQIDEARDAAAAANAKAAEANTKATEAANSTAEVKSNEVALSSSVADLKASNASLSTAANSAPGTSPGTSANTAGTGTNAASNDQADQNKQDQENTYSIRFKGITFSPGGFLAAETVWRQRSVQADVNTPFTSAPFPDNDLAHLSEFNASGRQSRLSFLAEGGGDNYKFRGYYEMDWLGACDSSNSRQSNSYCARQRQLWAQVAAASGWTVTGGQMWSLATETRKGLDNRTEATPMTIDAAYNVGFTWARQYGFRVTKNFGDKVWLGLAVEDPQLTITEHSVPTPFLVGAPASGGGTLNISDSKGYSANVTPDFIVKAAFEPGFGHYEVFGIVSTFRSRIYPCGSTTTAQLLPPVCDTGTGGAAVGTSAVGAYNNTIAGGGVGANARFPIIPQKADLGLHALLGDGVGRYSAAQLPDVTARPDGTLTPIRSAGFLGTLELHPHPKLDVYFDFGIEASERAAYSYFTNPATGAPVLTQVGFGNPAFNNSGCETPEGVPAANSPFTSATSGTCTADPRNIYEATVGFWHKLYQGPKGGVRWGVQYSYLVQNSWSGTGGLPAGSPGLNAKGVDNMVFTSFRYYIP
jgi:hypothetical protein